MRHLAILILFGAGALCAAFGATRPAIACIAAGLFVGAL